MSTRSNILITDGSENLLFYKHSDGYPTGQETLLKFMDMVKKGKIRDNVSQSAGWLVILGREDYNGILKGYKEMDYNGMNWKVGSYEPCDFYGSDIEYFYVCNIKELTIIVYEASLWDCKLGKDGLRSEKNIKKAIEKGWLKEIGIIKKFDNDKVLEKLKGV